MQKPFNLEAALRGEPVFHVIRRRFVDNLAKVGNRVAFTIPGDGDAVYQVTFDGTSTHEYDAGIPILIMKARTKTVYANIWDSPSFHYTLYDSRDKALSATGLAAHSLRTYQKLNSEPIELEVPEHIHAQ